MVSLARAYHLDIPDEGKFTITAEQLKELLYAFEDERGAAFAGVIKSVLVFGGQYDE